ncbi:hypothetical protein [Tenacibaculum maritimum]|uniref:hypothetical protein n=1 Tax=Tenacibaculum maritimum TaxID=107401 RepID=UPI00133113C5|nr:hypothetical protein [Tenacibaculum maritimum]
MENNILKYKGYFGSIEIDFNENILFGKIIDIDDLVNYEAKTPSELKKVFFEAVENYLDTCKEIGKIL